MKSFESFPSITRLAIVTLFTSTATSQALVVINNLAPGTQGFAASLSGPDASFGFFGTFENRAVAFSFVTGASHSVLTSLSFSGNVGDPDLSPIQADLSTGSPVTGGQVPITLGSTAPASAVPVTQQFTITPASTIPLEPGTTYWIHLTVPAGAGIYTLNNANTPVTEPGWSLGNTWYYDPDFGGAWGELTSGPQARISLNVQNVPEPGMAALAGLALFLCQRRKRWC